MLLSSELTAEAERRSKAVLNRRIRSSGDLHAKQANLAAAMVNLGYTKIYAPGRGHCGGNASPDGQLCFLRGAQVIAFV